MTGSSFEILVGEALDSLPPEIVAMMENVEVVVENEPPPELVLEAGEHSELMGYYHGIPLTDRGTYGGVLPDKISIYEGPITRVARTPEAIREQVRITVLHEIGHHFGIEEDRLHQLGYG